MWFFFLVQCVSLFYRSLGAFTIPLCFVLLHAFFPLSLSLKLVVVGVVL